MDYIQPSDHESDILFGLFEECFEGAGEIRREALAQSMYWLLMSHGLEVEARYLDQEYDLPQWLKDRFNES